MNKLQAHIRGFLARKKIAKTRNEFLNMISAIEPDLQIRFKSFGSYPKTADSSKRAKILQQLEILQIKLKTVDAKITNRKEEIKAQSKL